MASKALIIGALPKPFEGPWIPIDEAEAWSVVSGEADGAVLIETCEGFSRDGPLNEKTVSNLEHFSGQYARALIVKEIPDVDSVSVEIKAVR